VDAFEVVDCYELFKRQSLLSAFGRHLSSGFLFFCINLKIGKILPTADGPAKGTGKNM